MKEDLLSLQDCANSLGVSLWTVFRLVKSRQLLTIRVGRRRLVKPSELSAFVNRGGTAEVNSSHASRPRPSARR